MGGGSGHGHGSCETGQTGRGTSRSGRQKRVDCDVVESPVSQIIEDAVEDLGFQLVRVRFSGAKNGRNQLQIMAEPKEDREMTVEDCETLSRHVAALLDVDDPITSAYMLEVSSPGIDRPLTRIEDYDRFAGELAKLTLRFMLDGRKRFNGRLGGRDEDGKIIIDTAFGKFTFAFDEIDSARIDPTEIFTREATARS
jgi:ribosome maturation factor RimP